MRLIMQIMFPKKEDNAEYAFKLAKSHNLVTTKASKVGLKKSLGGVTVVLSIIYRLSAND